jgi:uncharacterized protein
MSPATGFEAGTTPNNAKELDDFYVPGYQVLIKGQQQPHLEKDILSITYNDSLKDVDSVDLVVNNWDPDKQGATAGAKGGFLYSDDSVLNPWQDIAVKMGYFRGGKDQLKPMLTGEIVTMAPNFPAAGGSTLTVRALNLLHQFRTQQKTLQFKELTDSQIANKIVEDINKDIRKKLTHIELRMDPEEIKRNMVDNNEIKHPYLEMHSQYPIVFLMQRSRDIGYDISLEDVIDKDSKKRRITFHYRSSGDVLRNVYSLEWGKSLISFQPTLQTAKQVNSVTVRGWNVQTKKPIEETATRADLVKKGEKTIAPEDLAVSENSLAQKLEIVVDRGLKDPKEAKEVAKKTLRQLAQGLVEAKGKTIGLPDLRAGSKVQISGLGRFDGTYMVTSTTHSIGDGGYTTDFMARMEAKEKKAS